MSTNDIQANQATEEGSTEGENEEEDSQTEWQLSTDHTRPLSSVTTGPFDTGPQHPDHRELPFKIGDPVMDCAQGRPMVVLDVPPQTVAEWSGDNGYELADNYGNQKFGVDPNEPVVTCRYVSDVGSDPSKTYTFPASRLRLIDVHHADDGRRIYDRVAADVLRGLFKTALVADWDTMIGDLRDLARGGVDLDDGVIDEALELADVDRRFEEADE